MHSSPFVFLAGGPFEGPNDAMIDDVFTGADPATGKPYTIGDTVMILDYPFRVSGIVEQGKGGRKLIPIDKMGELVGAEDKASLFYIKCDSPANDDLVMQEIHSTRGFGNNTLTTVDSWLDQMTPSKIPGFNIALDTVTGIAVIIGFLVIFQSMYTAVLERTREIGILKSMGASKMTIVFTTHTPVAAGHDRFTQDLINFSLGGFVSSLGITLDEFMNFGRVNINDKGETFCMTVLALKMSRGANAVSELNGKVSRQMWTGLYPEKRRRKSR